MHCFVDIDDMTVQMNAECYWQFNQIVFDKSLLLLPKGSVVDWCDWCNTQRQYKQKVPTNNETMHKDPYNGNINFYLSHFPRKNWRTWHLALTFDFNNTIVLWTDHFHSDLLPETMERNGIVYDTFIFHIL